jgi:predicted Zn-dependent protease
MPKPGSNQSTWRKLTFATGFTAAFLVYGLSSPAFAQLRDTETEEMLNSYERPLARAAGLEPSPRVWLVGDNIINAFATYGENGENIFIFSGILLWLKTPNELIGVMAHETGHISAGHLSRGMYAMKKAMIPMLLSLVAGVGRDDRGRRRSGHGDHGRRPGLCHGPDGRLSPACRNPPPTRSPPSCCSRPISRRWACTAPSSASPRKRR